MRYFQTRRITMPLIQVTAEEGTVNKQEQDQLIKRIGDAVLTAERAPVDDKDARSLVWAYFNEQAQGSVYVGGENIHQPPLHVAVTTPAGALDQAARESLVAAIDEIVGDIVGPYQGRLNHWVNLHEIAEGSWAGGGNIFPLAGIQQAMNIKPR
jgi:phenylpyruvate tautomerase PptA (4-oxalocrotonate tautomerase family)